MPKREREEENTESLPAKRHRGPNHHIINAGQKMARTRIQALYKANRPLNASTIKLPKSASFKNQTEEYQKIYESSYLARMLVELRENHLTIINKIQVFTQIEIELQKDLTTYKELQEKIQTTINTNAEFIALLKESLQYNKELQITLQNIISKLNGPPEVNSAESLTIANARDNARQHTNKIIKKVGETAENISKIEISINDFAGYTALTAYISYKNNALTLEISLGHETYRRGDESYKQVYVEKLLQRLQKFVSGDKVSIVIKNEGQETTLPLRNESPVILEKQPLALESASTATTNDVLFITPAENRAANERGNASQSIQASYNTLENVNHRASEHTRFVLDKITNDTNISAIDFQIQPSSLKVVVSYGDGSSPLTIEVPSKAFFKSDIDSQNIYLEKLKQSLSNKLIRKTTGSAQYYQTAGLSNNLFMHNLFEQTQPTNQHARVENAQPVMELDDRFQFETTVMPLDGSFVFERKTITSLAPEQLAEHNITIQTQAENLAERIFQSGQLQNKAKIKQMEIKCSVTQKKLAILFQYRGNINPYLLNVDIADDFWQESKSERALYLKTLQNALEQKIMNFQSTPDQTKVRNAAVKSATSLAPQQLTEHNIAVETQVEKLAERIFGQLQNKTKIKQMEIKCSVAQKKLEILFQYRGNINSYLLNVDIADDFWQKSNSERALYLETLKNSLEQKIMNLHSTPDQTKIRTAAVKSANYWAAEIPPQQQGSLRPNFFNGSNVATPVVNYFQLGAGNALQMIHNIEQQQGRRATMADKAQASYLNGVSDENTWLYYQGFDTTFDQYVQDQNADQQQSHFNHLMK